MRIFSKFLEIVGWIFGRSRSFEIPDEPRRNRLFELGREGFLGGGIDWDRSNHVELVVVEDDEEVTGVYDRSDP